MRRDRAYLTPTAVAEMLMVSPITVRQWAQKGELKALATPGGHRRFLLRDVQAFARERGLSLSHTEQGGLRILVVDDDKQFAGFIREFLISRQETISCEVAYSGFDAGAKVHAFRPDFVLLDLMMPGVDGFEVCSRLRADAECENVRIVAMTGYYNEENAARITQAGAEACIPKPIDPDTLLKVIGVRSTSESEAGLR